MTLLNPSTSYKEDVLFRFDGSDHVLNMELLQFYYRSDSIGFKKPSQISITMPKKAWALLIGAEGSSTPSAEVILAPRLGRLHHRYDLVS